MTFAISHGVPQAGIAFAVTMMLGVAVTLSAVTLAAASFRQQLIRLLETRPHIVATVTRTIQLAAGLVLVAWNVIASG
jgi:ABC-type nickel/cobalt efflux system permease component RcnA